MLTHAAYQASSLLAVLLPPPKGKDGRSNLGTGFALRCFQRLSQPDLATQQCPWRNNWHTIGLSLSVLSY
jgi:hypothetical protein